VLTRTRGAAVGLSDDVRNAIHATPDSQLAPTLDLYIGMPVTVTHNICIQLGPANGAVGRQLVTDDKGSQFQATSLPPLVLECEPRALRPDLPPRSLS
jgi:hypothetical protein